MMKDIALPRSARRQPGLVVAFANGSPECIPLWLDGPLRLGRQKFGIHDACVSREHAEVSIEGGVWTVTDLGSRNGTFVDGRAMTGSRTFGARPSILRMGHTVAVAVNDICPFCSAPPMISEGHVVGPTLRQALAEVERIAATGDNIVIVGESGSGKEHAARTFHRASPSARGPFVPVNCASIPDALAERLLFGTTKGAYTGATDEALGYVQAAHGGVLFLDEFGELSPELQATLLRVIETREVLPLGATRARRVDVRFCFATHRNLREEVAEERFRADLFYRVDSSTVVLPPLRARREEIPWLAKLELERAGSALSLSAEFIESCMLRVWPGNVRELLGHVRRALRSAIAKGSKTIGPHHLDPDAGRVVGSPHESGTRKSPVTREEVAIALREQPNASAAAKRLGIHRSHLYRLLKQFDME
jgi:transcriptional regulator with PAS, ATPase and Fis domain